MRAYYNDLDPFAAAWLRELIKKGLLPDGEVDERSILEVDPADLRPFWQCHFFAGIGGWPYALRLAGWPDDREVWSGSCPCQPLSVAGQRKGHADQRHLWPAFYRLIAERRPARVFGEQVAGLDGREWLAGVRADLEAAGYACGAASLPACAVAAPHRRERLFWGAYCSHEGEVADLRGGTGAYASGVRLVADADESGRRRRASDGAGFDDREDARRTQNQRDAVGGNFWDDAEWLIGADGKARRVKPGVRLLAHGLPARVGRLRGYGNAIIPQVAAKFVTAFMEAAA